MVAPRRVKVAVVEKQRVVRIVWVLLSLLSLFRGFLFPPDMAYRVSGLDPSALKAACSQACSGGNQQAQVLGPTFAPR